LQRNAHWAGGEGLAGPDSTKTLQFRDGKVAVTDGPFAETKEVIGGFAILNYASHEQAIAGARRVMQIHADHGFTDLEIELRPMMEDPACGAQVPPQASAA
jgi:hypothetical protein